MGGYASVRLERLERDCDCEVPYDASATKGKSESCNWCGSAGKGKGESKGGGDWGNDNGRDDDPEVEISAKIGRDEPEDDPKVDATALAENGCNDSADEVDASKKNGRDKDDPLAGESASASTWTSPILTFFFLSFFLSFLSFLSFLGLRFLGAEPGI